MRGWMLLLVVALSFTGCAKAPPTLSPAATTAFYQTRVIKALDILRDTAIDAEAQTPKLLSTATTRRVVQAHQSALMIMRASAQGWRGVVAASLDELLVNLPPNERAVIAPYVALAKTVLNEIERPA